MANQLKMALIHAIIGLLEQGWRYRRIARELGVHRETVARYDRLRRLTDSKPSNPTAGSSPESGSTASEMILGSYPQNNSKPANVTPGSGFFPIPDRSLGPPSLCQPLSAVIESKLEAGLCGQRIWQDLVSEHGFSGFYSSVKRFIRRLGGKTPLPFRRMECPPGAEAQVDFSSGGWVIEDDKKRRTHVFRIVLSHSRKGYSEAVFKQDTENFIRVLENVFHAFGGVPRTLVIDNLKAAVKRADWFDPEIKCIWGTLRIHLDGHSVSFQSSSNNLKKQSNIVGEILPPFWYSIRGRSTTRW
jgi:transposase